MTQPTSAPSGRPRRLLVVANRSLGGAELAKEVQEWLQIHRGEVVVVVPAVHSEHWNAERFQWGMAGALGTPLPTLTDDDPEGERQARDRLAEAVERLRGAGAKVTGRVGASDPVQAVGEILADTEVDEVLISTLPAGISKWIGLDLPSRIERRFGLPVRQITAAAEQGSTGQH